MFNKKNIVAIIVALVAIVGAYFYFSGYRLPLNKIFPSSPWYAVHLSNGHVYFGHITQLKPETITLSKTHYIEVYERAANAAFSTSTSFGASQTPEQVYNLIKRGDNKTIATDNVLHINRAVVLFWEKINNNSDLANLLNESEKKEKK